MYLEQLNEFNNFMHLEALIQTTVLYTELRREGITVITCSILENSLNLVDFLGYVSCSETRGTDYFSVFILDQYQWHNSSNDKPNLNYIATKTIKSKWTKSWTVCIRRPEDNLCRAAEHSQDKKVIYPRKT